MIRRTGEEPCVVEYLKSPPSRAKLKALLQGIGLTARDLLRQNEDLYTTLGLADEKWTEDQLIDLMREHPILMNRPIVETPLGIRLCRPAKTAIDILPSVL